MVLSFELSVATFILIGVVSAQYYAITGVNVGVGMNGSRPARQNINVLQTDLYAWPLYIQSLAAMQNISEAAQNSYFQIAGIHGRPYYAWNNIQGQFDYTGYCTHDSILFPTWHRPYLALFEQELNLHAQAIALQYRGSNKAKYVAAAMTLRMPYWDWAASAAIPTILNTPEIAITTPNGKQRINNPLFSYKFPPLDPAYFPNQGAYDSYLANDSTTIRDPNASSNLVNAGLTAATYNLFSHTPGYENVATQAVSGSSLEAVHGTVHVNVGGNYGDMTQLSYAAFDPIFWLHHVNVDRIFALWQAIYPNSFIPAVGLQDNYGTFTIAPGTTETSRSSLTPFTSSATGSLYTSDNARHLKSWGYTYPEISDWNQTQAQLSATVISKVNALYNPNGVFTRHKRHTRDMLIIKESEWFVNIQVAKTDLRNSSVVYIFLGDPPADTSVWKGAGNLAGSLFVSVPPNYLIGDSSRNTYSEIPLKEALLKVSLPDTSVEIVAAYLKENLEWRVQNIDGTVVDLSNCPSLQIQVQEEEVTPPEDKYKFPTYGTPMVHPEITVGKVGGYDPSVSE